MARTIRQTPGRNRQHPLPTPIHGGQLPNCSYTTERRNVSTRTARSKTPCGLFQQDHPHPITSRDTTGNRQSPFRLLLLQRVSLQCASRILPGVGITSRTPCAQKIRFVESHVAGALSVIEIALRSRRPLVRAMVWKRQGREVRGR